MPQAPSPKNDAALVIADLGGGGAQRVLTSLANRWAGDGRRIAVITLSGAGAEAYPLDDRVLRLDIGRPGVRPRRFGPVVANLRRILALRRALVLAGAPTVVAFVGATNVLAVLAGIGLGLRIIISERNDPARQSLGRPWDLLRRLLYRRAAVVTANSRGALRSLARFVPGAKLAYVPNPLVPPGEMPRREPEPMILNVGRLVPQKAQDVLLEAFAHAARDAPGWRLAVLGEGPDRVALASRAQALGIADQVELPGHVDPWPYYARASVFALPSRFEGTPNALLEAMWGGLPVVVSDASGGPLEFVTDGETGLVVPPDDPNALAAALGRLMTDEPFRHRLEAAAAQAVEGLAQESVWSDWDRLLGFSPT